MSFFIAVSTGDLAEILLVASLLLLLFLGRRVGSYGRGATGIGTSLFFLSFFPFPIFFLFFPSFLGGGFGSLLGSLRAIRRLRLWSHDLWLSFFGLFVKWLLGRQLGMQKSVASRASLIEVQTRTSLELGLGFGPGCFLDQIDPAELLSTFFIDPQFY